MKYTRAAILMAIANIAYSCFFGDWHTTVTAIYFQTVAVFVCWLWGVGSCKTNQESK